MLIVTELATAVFVASAQMIFKARYCNDCASWESVLLAEGEIRCADVLYVSAGCIQII